MRRRAPLLPFLASAALAKNPSTDASVAVSGAGTGAAAAAARAAAVRGDTVAPADSSPSPVKAPPFNVGTKDAPVDGKDGRPHEGPFVDIENLRPTSDADAKKKNLHL